MEDKLINKIFGKKRLLVNKNLEFKCDVSDVFYPVLVKVTARKKTISIRVFKNKIIINAPNFIEENFILNLLERKKKWISKNLLNSNYKDNNNFRIGEAYYLGKKYKINVKKGSYNKIIMNKDNLELIYVRKNTKIKNILENWYKKKCFYLLHDRINFFAKQINVEYKDFLIRSYKARLGSCDNKKSISFNWKLIFMPAEVIDYVVIHELCHIVHFNHSKLFWNEVYLHCPKYKDHKKWITENINILKY